MKTILGILILIIFLAIPVAAFAKHGKVHVGDPCRDSNGNYVGQCEEGSSCTPNPDNSTMGICTRNAGSSGSGTSTLPVFGKIVPPVPVQGIGDGSAGLSNFLTRVVELIYIAAAIAFIFMILIAAFNWITSGGDKDKVAGAQKRITNAIIGIVLLALTFVIVKFIGQIVGFTFFEGQEINIPQAPESGLRNTQKDDSFRTTPTPTRLPTPVRNF